MVFLSFYLSLLVLATICCHDDAACLICWDGGKGGRSAGTLGMSAAVVRGLLYVDDFLWSVSERGVIEGW